jgi:hypothetical protein
MNIWKEQELILKEADKIDREAFLKVNKLYIFIYLLFSLSAFLFSQNANSNGNFLYSDPYAKFSFYPPPSFREVDRPFHMFLGIANEDYVPIISFFYTIYEGSLDEFIALLISQMESDLRDFSLLSRADFATNNSIIGKRFMITHEIDSRILKQTNYCFARRNVKIVITCTVLYADEEIYDRVFDESIMTFQWIN